MDRDELVRYLGELMVQGIEHALIEGKSRELRRRKRGAAHTCGENPPSMRSDDLLPSPNQPEET